MNEKDYMIKELVDNIEFHKKEIEILKSKINLGKKLVDVVISDIQPKETSFHYQDNPEFWAIQKELTLLSHQEEQMQQEERIGSLESVIEIKQEKLAELQNE